MRKASSRSVLSTRKTKTTVTVPESKKVSRINKVNSCVKINSQNTEHNSNYNATLPLQKGQLQKLSEQLLEHLQVRANHSSQISQRIEKGSVRQSRKTSEVERNNNMSADTVPTSAYIQEMQKLKGKNQELIKENASLKEKCCELQEMSLKDKDKIKNLIIRINEVKQGRTMTTEAKTMHPSASNLPLYQVGSAVSCAVLSHKKKIDTPSRVIKEAVCQNRECLQRRKYLEGELYKERISRDRLQVQKQEWQKNKELLKRQYNELLGEIREMRNDEN